MNGRCRDLLGIVWEGSWARAKGGLHSANSYSPEQPEESNMNSEWKQDW